MDVRREDMFVFVDRAGAYYVLPRDMFERGRVADGQHAAVEDLLTGGDAAGFVESSPVQHASGPGLVFLGAVEHHLISAVLGAGSPATLSSQPRMAPSLDRPQRYPNHHSAEHDSYGQHDHP